MFKLLAYFLAVTATLTLANGECPENATLCGSTVTDVYQCADTSDLEALVPAGNDPANCMFNTTETGVVIFTQNCCGTTTVLGILTGPVCTQNESTANCV